MMSSFNVPNARFPKTFTWSKNRVSFDNEQMRAEVKETVMICCEKDSGKSSGGAMLDGASSTTESSLRLQTPNPQAKDIECDDLVRFEGQEYTVIGVQQIRSVAYKNAKEWLVLLH